ncbi:hypothetical protein LJC49_05350 [Ruminococcaceae bacterium OttesenSCG-928-I18]|nr:hypothetical protein [Ruminococcaceae bacterium OttesenSCG-928-I18]
MTEYDEGKVKNTENIVCDLCDLPLEPAKTVLTYMRSTFATILLRCPKCKQCYFPEDLALGQAVEVESTLEEK